MIIIGKFQGAVNRGILGIEISEMSGEIRGRIMPSYAHALLAYIKSQSPILYHSNPTP